MRHIQTVIGLGEVLWDIFPERKAAGGAPANFVYHATRFGLEGCVVSAVGKDSLGREMRNNLDRKGLRYLIGETDEPTGTVRVTLDEYGIPQYEICENVAWDHIPFIPQSEELARRCSAVCFGSLAQRSAVSRTSIRRFLESIPTGALRVFDINLRQHFYNREIIEASLHRSNILKINDEELVTTASLLGYSGLTEEETCRKLLTDFHLDIVVETKGSAGSCVVTGSESSCIETPKVQVADTVGAGDSFTGAFVAALLRGRSVVEAHQLAVEVSAFVCTRHGAMPPLPDALTRKLR